MSPITTPVWKPKTRKGALPPEPQAKESWTWFWTLVAAGILLPPVVALAVNAALGEGKPPVPAPPVEVVEAPPEVEPAPVETAAGPAEHWERIPGDVLSDLETAFVEGTSSVLVRLATSDEEWLFEKVRGEGQMPWLEGFTIVRLGAPSENERLLQLSGRGPSVVVRMERNGGLWRLVSIRPAASAPAAKAAPRNN